MGDAPGHIRKAQHNEKFLHSITNVDAAYKIFPDWFLTVAFYIALHYVDRKLAKMNLHPTNHNDRDRLVAANLPQISGSYQSIKMKSEYARYFVDSEKDLDPIIVRQYIDLALNKFK